MKKLKKFWLENSVLLVLLLILIACLIAISVVVVNYFVGDSNSKYGDRNIQSLSKEIQKELISKIEEDELIENVSLRVSDTRTIYLTIKFVSKTTLVEAQSKSLAALEFFSEDILSNYDIEFLIKVDSTEETDGFQLMGSRNVSGTGGIVWNNNTIVKEEE